jgi:glycosyltransferase involved in cell wall biosynthesis
MKIAVVIPIKNEKEGLSELAEHLLKQTLVPDEIIFVDAGSTDGSIEILKNLSEDYKQIRLLIAPGAFPGVGRNIGIKNTDADIIAQIDGGNLPNNCWLDKICAPIVAKKADYVVGGIKIMPIWKNLLGVHFNIGEVYGASLYGKFQDEKNIGGGACVAYRREIWEKVGGFPEFCRLGEDPIFAMKVMNLKVKTAFVSDAYIYWQIGPKLVNIVERQIRYQKAKFRKPKSILKFKGTLLLPTLILIIALLSFFLRHLWIAMLGILLVYWLRKCVKAFKVYRTHIPERISGRKYFVILGSIAFIEFIHILSKALGTVLGIGELKNRKQFIKMMNNYLYG